MSLSGFGRYLIVGAGAVLFNLVAYFLLIELVGMTYLPATVVVFLLGNLYGFLANRRFSYAPTDRSWRRPALYLTTAGLSLFLNLALMALLVGAWGFHYLLASVAVSVCLAPVLYVAHGFVAFRTRRPVHDPLRVVLVTHYFAGHGGGVEIVAGEIAERLGYDHDVHWWAAGDQAANDAEEAGHVVRHPMRAFNGIERRLGLPWPIPSPLALVRLVGAVREADIVWVHDLLYPSTIVAAMAAILARRPLAVTVHVGEIAYPSPLARTLMHLLVVSTSRLLLSRASFVAFVSERVRADFTARFSLRDERLIPNGLDASTFGPLGDGERQRIRADLGIGTGPVALFVGRFVERKGVAMIGELARRMPDVTFVLAGAGPIEPASWNLPNVVVVRGRRGTALAEIYAMADVFVLPSTGEGFPLVVQEALSCGLTVIVDPTTLAGYPPAAEVVETEDVTGPDALDRYEARLGRILADETARDTHEPRALDFAARHWDWSRTTRAYAERFAAIGGGRA